MEKKFESELTAFKQAERLLRKPGNVRADLPTDKVIERVKNQQQQLKRLKDGLAYYETKLEKLEHVKLVVDDLSQTPTVMAKKRSFDEKVNQAKKQAEEENNKKQRKTQGKEMER